MSQSIELLLSVQTDVESQDETPAILGALERELDEIDADFSAIAPDAVPSDMLEKGDGLGSVLDIKIDLDALRSLGSWIYQRLTPGVKVKFKHKDDEFEFEGRNQTELADAMAEFERFFCALEASE